MTRMFATVAVIALITTGAQAGPPEQIPASVHNAAVAACAPVSAPNLLPRSYYGAIEDQCIWRLSRSAMPRYNAMARAAQSRQVAQARP